jgi:hypothetical protein
VEKNNKIKELSLQNKFLLNENKTLKIKIIQFFYIMKLYMKNGKKLYNDKYQKIIKGLILENKFLRSVNIMPKSINSDYLSKLKNQIQIAKMKKELIMHNHLTNRNEKNSNNNISAVENNIKDINNPFVHDENSLNDLNNKVSHKRQRTHFNLGKLNEDNNSNRDSIGSSHNTSNEQSAASINTIVDNKDRDKEKDKVKDKDSSYHKNSKNMNNHSNSSGKRDNIFCEALKEMSNYNRTLKKMNNNSKKNLLENKNENNNENMKNNKSGNKMIYNIPYNMNKMEFGNNQNDKIENGDSRKNSKIDLKNDLKNNNKNYPNDREIENENLVNKKQQSIYYRSAREKEKKKIEFTK